jgi:tetratricopeptide (TPR) repeat protein
VRGAIYEDLQQYEEALAEYERAIEVDPNYVASYIYRADVLRAKGNIAEALVECERAIAAVLHATRSYLMRAQIHREQGQYAEATADCEQALETNPDDLATLDIVAEILIECKQIDKATTLIERSLAITPDNDWLHYLKGLASTVTGEAAQAVLHYQEAKRCAEAILAVAPLNSRVQYNLALYHLLAGNQEAAYAAYKQGIKICSAEKKFKGAIDDLKTVIRLRLDIAGASQMKELLEAGLAALRQAGT